MRAALRAVVIVVVISIAWGLVLGYGLLYLVFGDCFEPNCRANRDAQAEGLFWVAGIGYLLSLAAYFRGRVRRVKGD